MRCVVYRILQAVVVALTLMTAPVQAEVVVVCNASLSVADRLNPAILARIYTGRTIQIDGISVLPVNLAPGTPERSLFLQHIMGQNDDEYIGYWLVRKSIGRGTPPQEFKNAAELQNYIRSTPGSIGYIDKQHLESGVRSLFRIP
ncbi:hypothetical protein [Desulfobulbus oligotrophicus]|jgi:ABC-type phosphate transport system substrate-binding protein|uniref:Phosphate ABC transporter substrate-binding protein n=1 Tax=Desulfobulbus oligotrophicus TaxID=1909699 RepID=A0A7T6ARJ8_9BACT|nr:hypothetical protein [Desulfobulbus oligotrophicus]MDY0389751.1 hypothetical protein [Desulfobulbus oligotrophicus]QQG66605.1 hypothetical protein HP555_12360 [Desulfobulbus oligotrophicus]